jgi:hypothetical protein
MSVSTHIIETLCDHTNPTLQNGWQRWDPKSWNRKFRFDKLRFEMVQFKSCKIITNAGMRSVVVNAWQCVVSLLIIYHRKEQK